MSESNLFETLSAKGCVPEMLQLLPEEAVVLKYFDVPEYGAIWDLFMTKEGRIFLPLCAELCYPKMTRLYEYIPEENRLQLHFNIEDVTIQEERRIRTSKIHTSMAQMPDGRLIMTTHTTARAPQHPDWMVEAYHAHAWEGYQGSHILIYDYKNGKVEDRGIPVPFESIYGAKYDVTHNCLYFLGYLMGHLYRYDVNTNRVTDYGKVGEYGSWKICEGPDGNFYSSNTSGEIFRINLATQQIEMLGIEIPSNNGKRSENHRLINHSVIANGKMYFQCVYALGLWGYDPADNTLEYVGDFRPEKIGDFISNPDIDSYAEECDGLIIDEEGCLWYNYLFGGLHLVRWDFLRGGKPEYIGIVGNPKRSAAYASEMLYHDGKLYISDTNHAQDGPGMIVVDLNKLKIALAEGKKGDVCGDGYVYLHMAEVLETPASPYIPGPNCNPVPLKDIYPGDLMAGLKEYWDQDFFMRRYDTVMKENPCGFQAEEIHVIHLWRKLSVEKSQVHNLYWQDAHTLIAQVGGNAYDPFRKEEEIENREYSELTITDGEIVSQKTIENVDRAEIPDCLKGLDYPAYPGRQYKAVPTACAPWKDGEWLVGTRDGMMAVVRADGSVLALGTAAKNGPVHSITVNAERTLAYGVAGDPMEKGNVFRYDEQKGLRWEGIMHRVNVDKGPVISADQLSCIALSPDQTCLAIGSKDRIGCIFLVRLQ